MLAFNATLPFIQTMNTIPGKDKTVQVSTGLWRVVRGDFSGMHIKRREVGTDIDGETIYDETKLLAGDVVVKTFSTLREAWASL